ncbi:MAG: hypothetical protein Hyperionvirus15_32 [Hyperionvirus sp.]|uniref:Uncharacterized protein n=1 Tax=Hyperionvirus sp. TaxID=2487770 RepID=A0A3G5ABN0_9VIRU|nr:MAG: hypothetical protein Hyperionvirus15_32 [Hyperionvirus sp.]
MDSKLKLSAKSILHQIIRNVTGEQKPDDENIDAQNLSKYNEIVLDDSDDSLEQILQLLGILKKENNMLE